MFSQQLNFLLFFGIDSRLDLLADFVGADLQGRPVFYPGEVIEFVDH